MEIVYVIHNPEMPGLVKIGWTEKSIEARMLELDTTGIPVPFECLAAWEIEDAKEAEKAIHNGVRRSPGTEDARVLPGAGGAAHRNTREIRNSRRYPEGRCCR